MKFKLKLLLLTLSIFINTKLMTAQETTITGIAYNVKGGAIVQTDSMDYWIEGKESWEEIYYEKTIKVTGLLSLTEDSRVFVDTADIKIQGIPVKSKKEKDSYPKMVWIKPSRIEVVE